MKVILDGSVLGAAQRDHLSRTGIYRVVENIASRLASSEICELCIYLDSSYDIFIGYKQFVRQNRDFRKIPISNTKEIESVFRFFDISENQIPLLRDIIQSNKPKTIIEGLKPVTRFKRCIGQAILKLDSNKLKSSFFAEADIYHSPHKELIRISKDYSNLQRFLTIYDLVPIIQPSYSTFRTIATFKKSINSLLINDWVICISESTKQDLLNYKEIDPEQVFVIPLAASKEFFYPLNKPNEVEKIRNKYKIPPGPYVLSLNTLEPRKNIHTVINSFARLVLEQKINGVSLVLVGSKGWKYDQIFTTLSKYPELRKRIIITGYVEDLDLAALYGGALVFVYPSFYEGFGLPVLEAMQCGIPVITSNTSSLPEVVGDAGKMFDPTDVESYSHEIWNIYKDSNYRKDLSMNSFQRASKFTWERCTQDTLAAYQYAINNKSQ